MPQTTWPNATAGQYPLMDASSGPLPKRCNSFASSSKAPDNPTLNLQKEETDTWPPGKSWTKGEADPILSAAYN
jgi:hypothetical protein